MGRNVVIALAAALALLVIAVVGVAGRDWIGGMIGGGHETPTVMIISSDLLETSIASSQQSKSKLDAAAAKITAAAPAKAPDPKAPAGAPGTDSRSAQQMQADDLNMVVQAMEDSLGGKVAQTLQESQRFQLIASSRVVDEMDDYAKQNHITRTSLLQSLSGMVVGASATPRGTTASVVKEQSSVVTHGLPEVGRRVGADYVLVVTLGEPHFGVNQLPPEDGQYNRIQIVGQPIIDCEIFQTNGKLAYRFSKQLDKPIIETAINDEDHRGDVNAKLYRFQDRLDQVVSQQVLAWALDKIAPARIVQGGSTLIINRGTNDGVADGAVYQVEREVGDPVREGPNGADLGRLRVPEGSIVIQRAQERIATATVASGGPLLKDDVVDVLPPQTPGGSPATQGPHQGPLNVAVDHVRLGGTESAPLAQAVSDALAADGRIAVLPRAELGVVRGERQLNAAAGDDYGSSSFEGMRQSDVLVDGECGASSQRHTSYITVNGYSQPTGTRVTSSASCTLRATAVDGRLIGTASEGGGSVAEAARAAARTLLASIVQSAGGGTPAIAQAPPQPAAPPPSPAPPPASNAAAAAAPPKPKIAADRRRPAPARATPDENPGIHF